MVAPHVETQLTRSLVRIPNSGRDRRAGAVLHDLSRVSSAAALVPITSYFALGILPSTLSPPRSQAQVPQPSSLLCTDKNPLKLSTRAVPCAATAETSTTSGARVMSRGGKITTNSSSATVNPTGSRKRSVQQDHNSIATEVRSPKIPRTTTTPRKPTQQSRRSTPRPVTGDYRIMGQLLREREQLLAENMALKLELSRRSQERFHLGL
ncbi:uncharacterized protein LOC123498922 [Portunus trituberculatus]|uniref:uncharacterized protein LOC123498922 n=1 Tax=Portunus trituberculatus TaxID=210409 RepID=UPI001E1CB7FA|nr:uncharacterized protein LOC123498922 [Portunus trituberculatus]